MGRRNSPIYSKELNELVDKYEAAIKEDRQLYLDADQIAGIADYYGNESRFKEAQKVIDYGLRLHPQNTDLLVTQAFLYLDTQKTHLAKLIAETITDDFNIDIKMLRAEILLIEGQLEATKNLLNSVAESDELETIIDIIYLYLDMGYPEAAKEWIDKMKERYKDDEDFIAVTADYLLGNHQIAEASDFFNRLLDIDPYNAAYWIGLARCRFIEEDFDKTIEACDFALAADDKFGDAYSYRGHCYFYLNNMDAAIENYEKAIEYKALAPEMGYMFIGIGHSNKEEWLQADKCFRTVIRIFEEDGDSSSPLLVEIYISEALVTFNLGNYKEAHLLIDKAKAINPKEENIYLAEGKLYLKEELNKEAHRSFMKALKEEPTAETWLNIGSAYMDEDLLEQAKTCYEKAYKINPEYPEIVEKLSILSLMNNEIDKFLKYNSECEQPLDVNSIIDLLSQYDKSEEGKKILLEVLERLRKENNNFNS